MPVAADQETLGDRLRRLRTAAGLTQQQLATAAGLAMSNVSQIEQGKVADPRLSTMVKLARALKVRLNDLVGEENLPS